MPDLPMNFVDTLPTPAGINAPAGIEDFRIADPMEVRDLLRRLCDEKIILHVHGPDGVTLLTTLFQVDSARQTVMLSADEGDLRVDRLIECEELVVVGFLQQVKLQFELNGVMLVRAGRDTALRAQMPREMYRFQRRDAYRVRPLSRGTPTAYLAHPSIPDMHLALRILDVSAGGCAIHMPNDVPPLALGVRINGVHVELDADTDFHASIVLHHVTSIHPDSPGTRLGCEWVGMSSDAARSLQRFIDLTQRRHRRLMPET